MSLCLNREQLCFFNDCLTALSETAALGDMDAFPQHGSTSCLWHSVAVAYYSYRLAGALGLACDEKSLIRGALLHDYFLYDWHEPDASHRLHGFRHPSVALANARQDVALGAVECDIIAKHMFPLTPRPPRFRESLLVCLVDKLCSIAEVLFPNPHARLKRECGGARFEVLEEPN